MIKWVDIKILKKKKIEGGREEEERRGWRGKGGRECWYII